MPASEPGNFFVRVRSRAGRGSAVPPKRSEAGLEAVVQRERRGELSNALGYQQVLDMNPSASESESSE